jgi:hypothetical protein
VKIPKALERAARADIERKMRAWEAKLIATVLQISDKERIERKRARSRKSKSTARRSHQLRAVKSRGRQ